MPEPWNTIIAIAIGLPLFGVVIVAGVCLIVAAVIGDLDDRDSEDGEL
jgi:hypothetical protein